MSRALIYRLAVGFTIAFVLLVGIGVLGYQQNAALVRDATLVSDTHQVIARLAELMGALDLADSSGQLAAVTHASTTIVVTHTEIARIAPAMAELRILMADTTNQQRLDRLEVLLHAQAQQIDAALSASDPTLIQLSTKNEIDTLVRTMQREERQLLDVHTAQSQVSVARTQEIMIGGSLIGLLIGLGTAAITIVALRARDHALHDLVVLNSQLDARVLQQTAALSTANEQLEALSHRLIATQEVERATVATALHEAIGQEIAALQITLQIADDMSSDAAVRAQLDAGMTTIDRVLDQIRALSVELRPAALDAFELLETIRASVEPLAAQAGLDITVDAAPLSVRPPTAVETVCFRIAQEATALLIRAPGVHGLHIQLAERTGALELTISGDGTDLTPVAQAPDTTDSALTLLAIHERAAAAGGTSAVDVTAERGTSIVARFPLNTPATV